MRKHIRQIYYGRIVALISAVCVLAAGAAFYFGRVKHPAVLTVEVNPVYLISAQLPADEQTAAEQIKKQRESGYAGLVSGNESHLCVITSLHETGIFVLKAKQNGMTVKDIKLNRTIKLEAFNKDKDNSLFTRYINYPLYTIKKLNELSVSYKNMSPELSHYAYGLIEADFMREAAKAYSFNDKTTELYARIKSAFTIYKPQNISASSLNLLACGITKEYFSALDILF